MEFNLADLFECVADAVPEREAVVWGDRRLTFAQMDERATRLAHHLSAQGVKPGDHIGVYLYNCPEFLEAFLAAWKIRAVPVNINFRYVEDELRYLFTDADLVGLVFHREFAPRVQAVAPELPSLRTFVVVDDDSGAAYASLGAAEYEAAVAAASPARDFAPRSGDDLYLLYTGGTTGMPKGVMWRHEDVFFAGLQGGNPYGQDIERPEQQAEIARNSDVRVTLPAAPLMHGSGHWASLIGLHAGGKVALATSRRFDAAEIWRIVEREKVTIISIVGDAMARPMAEALAEPGASYDTSSLMVLTTGGAIFSESVQEQLRQYLPKTVFINAFGVSEAGHQGMGVGGSGARPRFTVEANTAVLDDNLRPVAPGSGVVGRLARRGRMPLGYYKDAEKTAATFVTVDGVRWVMPGDMAVVEADGSVTLLGRGSICINSGGEKIYPEEVEEALKSHPAIFDAVVVGVPDERWGERVAAVVQFRPGKSAAFDDVQAHVRTKISGYKAPREMHVAEQIVRSPTGKPDYRWAKAYATGSAVPAPAARER